MTHPRLPPSPPRLSPRGTPPSRKPPTKGLWLWGKHSVCAALENPQRTCFSVICTTDLLPFVNPLLEGRAKPPTLEILRNQEIEERLPLGAIHQGIALTVQPLEPLWIQEFLAQKPDAQRIVVLDQITDPQNFGALLRSACAFGMDAVLTLERNSPPLSGVVAKSASGALDKIPVVLTANLAQGLDLLKRAGFWCVGLTENGDIPLDQLDLNCKLAIVMGAEGKGLRRLTEELCDLRVALPTSPLFPTLNVSAAGAVVFYRCRRPSL